MDSGSSDVDFLAETAVFLSYFSEMPDVRQQVKVVYPLPEILLLCLMAVVGGADTFTEIARFGERKLELLRRFLPFENGTPSHDHLGDIFASLDAKAFQRCFVCWVSALTGKSPEVIAPEVVAPEVVAPEVVAIDGKTSRRSYQKKGLKAPIHMVSAFAARQRLVLGQVKVNEKSNEIVAIPALLEMIEIEGAVVTIDAMGCQRAIAKQIIEKKASYIVALKSNQGTLHHDITRFAKKYKRLKFKSIKVSRDETTNTAHGRIETRSCTVVHDVGWLQERHKWPGLQSIVILESIRKIASKTSVETRFYISSLTLEACKLGPMIRNHWAIENSLHWVMDMLFRDDECRIRTDNAPANFTTIKHIAYNLFRNAPGKDSLRLKRKTAAWDDNFIVKILTT